MNLHAMQRGLRRWLTRAEPLPGSDPRGLAVYQNNYRAQLVGCLEATYPTLLAFAGADAFRQAAVVHVNRHPPRAWTLDAYGAGFEDTLRDLFPDNPDLHELAWIEWACATAFVARDTQPLDPARLATIDWDRAQLGFAPSLHVRALSTNAAAIWSALQDGGAPLDAAMLPAPQGCVIWRRGLVARLRVVDPLDFAALLLARQERSFGALCALLVERLGADAGVARAGALLADWIGSELLTRITSNRQP